MPTNRYRIAIMLGLEWPYKRHAAVFAGTQQYAEANGWESIIDEYAEDSLPSRKSGKLPFDGIIARASKRLAERTKKLGIPVVNVWKSSPVHDSLPGVFPDYQSAGRIRAEHLLARGLRNFAALGCRRDMAHELEIGEFLAVTEEYDCPCHTAAVSLDYARTLQLWKKTDRTITEWMDRWQPPIGVYVGAESVGRIVVQKCRERGWRVPEDVAVIAGRNEEKLCEHPRPSLTSMEMGYEQVGSEAARLLHHLMDGGAPPKQPILVPPGGLVVRESTDFFAVDDAYVAAAVEFISRNSHRRIGQHDVARAANAETRTLQMRFRKHLGRPIVAEIRRVRIERAKRELAQSDKALAAIARDVGFGIAQRMYEVFRRELGISPSEYRRQRQVRSKN